MFIKEVVLEVDRELFAQEIAKAAFKAAGIDASKSPNTPDLRIQEVHASPDNETCTVKLVHADVYETELIVLRDAENRVATMRSKRAG